MAARWCVLGPNTNCECRDRRLDPRFVKPQQQILSFKSWKQIYADLAIAELTLFSGVPDQGKVKDCVSVFSKEDKVPKQAIYADKRPTHVHASNITSRTHSYVSAQTFFENKTGFEEGLLQTSTYCQPLLPFLMRNEAKLLLSLSVLPSLQQYRGFISMSSNGSRTHNQFGCPAIDEKRPVVKKKNHRSCQIRMVSKWNESNAPKGNAVIHFHMTEEPTGWKKYMPVFVKRLLFCMSVIALYFLYKYENNKGSTIDIWGLNVLISKMNQVARGNIMKNFPDSFVQLKNNYEVTPEKNNVTFKDVKGIEETTEELQDLVNFLSNPDKYIKLGAKIPKGVLLSGLPGCGKTLVAKAVAGEAGVPFFQASGSDFEEIFVGVGASRIRSLFAAAKAKAPCIVFIDEIDAVAFDRQKMYYNAGASQTVNQLLTEMDGFSTKDGVIVIGATNNSQVLDKALLRPGRFDVEINVLPPDVKGRKDIFNLYLSKVKVLEEIDVDRLAYLTYKKTGAYINNVVNQAALRAVKMDRDGIVMEDLHYALDKCAFGAPRKTRERSMFDKWSTAVHEAGHAIVACYTKGAMKVNKVTILPRTKSHGHTAFLPDKDFLHRRTKEELLARIDTFYGGRVAEEMILGQNMISEGCSYDLKLAAEAAQYLVRHTGMSDKAGYRSYPEDAKMSEEQMALLDNEINKILKESYERVRKLLETHIDEHQRLSKALMKYETIDMHELQNAMSGKPIRLKGEKVMA